ncbi:MAG TPA: hypothetical protein P5158_07205 [Chitinophagaceae bacterium]|nr:hypothetical protein [Chitinophagaceae bacterium]MCB9055236.1 hypothetical protein [Chitinophagales bacterium]HRX93883.1 hypothetical protein [Chitinophagaceae bacterium]
MTTGELQKSLFDAIKEKVAQNASIAQEVSELLDISADSAYRRMRGEKTITLDELYILCNHYKISLDRLMGIQTGAFLFQGNLLNPETFKFDAHLKSMMHNLAYFSSFKQKEYYYLCKDAPIFHHWYFKELAAFKHYFWMNTLLFRPVQGRRKFSFSEYPDELWVAGQQILELYNQLDSYEIWNLESLNSTIHQIEYYHDSNMFDSDQVVAEIYTAIEKTMDHLENQARLGYKYSVSDPDKKPMGKYNMFFNDTILLDNNMMAVLDDAKISIVPHTAINYMMSRDANYNESFYQYIQSIIRQSIQISEVSEKERSRFFRLMRDRVNRRKENLKL